MIAANDTDTRFLLDMAPDQLRSVLAHAGGLLAFRVGEESASRTMYRIADRLTSPAFKGPDWLANKATLSQATRDAVIRQVSEESGVTPEQILYSLKRGAPLKARMLAMYRLRQVKTATGMPKYSYPEIGRAFDRDHTTVMHACRKVRRAMGEQ